MPTFRNLSEEFVDELPKRVLSSRQIKKLDFYRSCVRSMLAAKAGQNSALELSDDEAKQVANIKRWLHRAAGEERVSISVRKRGGFLLMKQVDSSR